MSAALHEAHRLARLGYFVVPAYPLRPDGSCGCAAGEGCPKPGKHPINGYKTATKDPAQVRKLWQGRPDAGVGIDLERSGIVDIAPDSVEWLSEFERRGLPATAVYQSGGGEGHRHYWTRRPKDCPAARICIPDQYDLMSAGFSVVPPTPGKLQSYAWLTPNPDLNGGLPETPAWAVAMLKERAADLAETKAGAPRPAPSPTAADAGGDAEDEPPIELTGDALATWHGQRPKLKPDGTVDRSVSLVKLDRALFDAGITPTWRARLLRERDHDLGWHKFCERRDGEKQYAAIVALVTAEGRTPIATFDGGDEPAPAAAGPDPSPCADQVAALRARINQLEAENEELRGRFQTLLKLDRNPAIKAERTVVKAVAYELQSAYSRDAADADGWVKTWNGGLAENAGVSVDRVTVHTETMKRDALIDKKVERETVIDTETGEVKVVPRIYLRCRNVTELLDKAATWIPSPSPKKPERAGWGGKREADPATCLHANRQTRCLDCGTDLPPDPAPRDPHLADHQNQPEPTASAPAGRGPTYDHPQDADHAFVVTGSRTSREPVPDERRADGWRNCQRCAAWTLRPQICAPCDPENLYVDLPAPGVGACVRCGGPYDGARGTACASCERAAFTRAWISEMNRGGIV